MKELINSRIKKYFGTQKKFCAFQKYHFRGHSRKIKHIENSIRNINKFLNPLKLKVEIIPTNYDNSIYFRDTLIDVNYDYTPESIGDNLTPSFPAHYDLKGLYINGVDVFTLLDEHLEEIETILNQTL